MPRRSEHYVLMTEFIVPYSLGTPSFGLVPRQILNWIAVKPERLLELVVERQAAGGMGLTLSV